MKAPIPSFEGGKGAMGRSKDGQANSMQRTSQGGENAGQVLSSVIRDVSSRRALLGLLAVLGASAAAHLALAATLPLAEDETYYWEWSRKPAWGYYDQGPMIAWWIRAGTELFGHSPLGVRIGSVVASLATQVFAYAIAARLAGPRAGLFAVVALTLTPLAMAGGFLATYDSLQVMFWAAAIAFSLRCVTTGSPWAWLGLGAAFGLGILSKYTMAFLLPCLFGYLATSPRRMGALRSPWPWAGLGLGVLLWLPNLLWLARHDWITLRHLAQLADSPLEKPFWARAGDLIGSQAAILGPVTFLCLLCALGWAAKRSGGPTDHTRLLVWMSAPILIYFLAQTVRSKVLANWPAFAWFSALLLLGIWVAQRPPRKGRLAAYSAGIATSGLLTLGAVWPDALAAAGARIPASWALQANRMYGGRELGQAADLARREWEQELARSVYIAGVSYQEAARLAFYMPGRPRVLCLFVGTRANQYAYWNQEQMVPDGVPVLAVLDRPPDSSRARRLAGAFERIEWLPRPVHVYRRSLYAEPVRTYYLARCYGLHVAALAPGGAPRADDARRKE